MLPYNYNPHYLCKIQSNILNEQTKYFKQTKLYLAILLLQILKHDVSSYFFSDM